MENLKVARIENDVLIFEDGTKLYSNHEQDCCENHYLDFSNLDISDFDDLEFNLTNDSFFKRIKEYGIELIPIKGHSVKIAGYGSNNGYYSSDIDLVVADSDGKTIQSYDVSECQTIEG